MEVLYMCVTSYQQEGQATTVQYISIGIKQTICIMWAETHACAKDAAYTYT
jgi:hypothetical protein